MASPRVRYLLIQLLIVVLLVGCAKATPESRSKDLCAKYAELREDVRVGTRTFSSFVDLMDRSKTLINGATVEVKRAAYEIQTALTSDESRNAYNPYGPNFQGQDPLSNFKVTAMEHMDQACKRF